MIHTSPVFHLFGTHFCGRQQLWMDGEELAAFSGMAFAPPLPPAGAFLAPGVRACVFASGDDYVAQLERRLARAERRHGLPESASTMATTAANTAAATTAAASVSAPLLRECGGEGESPAEPSLPLAEERAAARDPAAVLLPPDNTAAVAQAAAATATAESKTEAKAASSP